MDDMIPAIYSSVTTRNPAHTDALTQSAVSPYEYARWPWPWPPATTASTLHPPPVPTALHDLNTMSTPVREIHSLPSNPGRWIKELLPSPATGPDLRPINTSKRLTVHMAIRHRDRPGQARVRVTGLPIDLLLVAFKWATLTPPIAGISHPSSGSFGYRIFYR